MGGSDQGLSLVLSLLEKTPYSLSLIPTLITHTHTHTHTLAGSLSLSVPLSLYTHAAVHLLDMFLSTPPVDMMSGRLKEGAIVLDNETTQTFDTHGCGILGEMGVGEMYIPYVFHIHVSTHTYVRLALMSTPCYTNTHPLFTRVVFLACNIYILYM